MNNMAVITMLKSGISNQTPDQDLEENIKICKDSDINISSMVISKAVIDFLLEEIPPAQQNELL